jgi:heme a synthase
VSADITAQDLAKNNKKLAYWLLGVSAMVAGVVTVGGVTRLTRSGLSMTDWKLQGSLPPMNNEEWEKEFARYKTFPEWQQRKSMTLDEFKFIYFWEYGHRMMGRTVGLAFTLPAIYFSMRGMIPMTLYPRLGLLFGLGGTQGLIGWWMVKSGLQMDPKKREEIRVSPYRLATHLSMAFTTYVTLLWTALDLLYPKQSYMQDVAKNLSSQVLQVAKKSRKFALHNMALVAVTVVSGAFVAGTDAGLAYNTFPKMGDEWIPSGIFDLTPWYKNIFENTALVQLDHRLLAYSTVSAIGLMYYKARTALNGAYFAALPRITRLGYHAVAGMAITQVGLGISTLLLYVPIPLAATHQFGSLVLLTLATFLSHSLSFSKFFPQVTSKINGSSVSQTAFIPKTRSFHTTVSKISSSSYNHNPYQKMLRDGLIYKQSKQSMKDW